MGPSLSCSRDRLAFLPRGGAMLPPAHSQACHGSWAWLALVSVINLPAPAVPINHTYKCSYNYHIKPKSFLHMLNFMGAWYITHTHIWIMVSLLVLPPVARQVSWLWPLMSGTMRYFRGANLPKALWRWSKIAAIIFWKTKYVKWPYYNWFFLFLLEPSRFKVNRLHTFIYVSMRVCQHAGK